MNKSIILMSGGLDSFVALGTTKEKYNITLALTFDYGQKSNIKEIEASKKICSYYNIRHEIISLDWLKAITKTALVSNNDIPTNKLGTKESATQVWVPNRNGLFLNIAACYADAEDFNYIIFGANSDEGQTFSDNTTDFRNKISELFKFSTLVKPKVIAPLIKCSKSDIVKIALDKKMPLELINSCYSSSKKHCGICESCKHLKNALILNNNKEYLRILFENYEN